MRRWVLAAIVLSAVGAVGAAAGLGGGDRAAQAARGPILTPLQQRLASGTLLRALDEPRRPRALHCARSSRPTAPRPPRAAR